MTGKIALVGGNEFRKNCEPLDRALLAQFEKRPRIRIVPTAARENPNLAAENGIRYFQKLGARAEAVNILNRSDAQNPALISLLEEADLFYFTGGNPIHLREVFLDSPAWKEVVGLWHRGRVLVGSSAGAMILGEKMWNPGQGWLEGLGVIPGLAVIPHHTALAARWGVRKMLHSLPAAFTLAGIDEATALIGPPWQVLGVGEVTLYRPGHVSSSPPVFKRGEEVIWDPLQST